MRLKNSYNNYIMPRKKSEDTESMIGANEYDLAAMEASRKLLKRTMEQMKWRAPQVAQALNCSDDVVRRWLRGERRIQVSDVVRLAQISGADLNEVFGLEIREGPPGLTVEQVKEMVEQEVQSVLGRILLSGYDATLEN
jgi:transcriptional regulator with XRE-family HTH domain